MIVKKTWYKKPPKEKLKIEWGYEKRQDGSWDWQVWFQGYDYQGNERQKGHVGGVVRKHIRLIEEQERKRNEQNSRDKDI